MTNLNDTFIAHYWSFDNSNSQSYNSLLQIILFLLKSVRFIKFSNSKNNFGIEVSIIHIRFQIDQRVKKTYGSKIGRISTNYHLAITQWPWSHSQCITVNVSKLYTKFGTSELKCFTVSFPRLSTLKAWSSTWVLYR